MTKAARRQHYVARFYLRNFAEPRFSENLCVYDMRKRRWDWRTPDGVGWFPHLYSSFDEAGNRTDEFDQFLKIHVEDPAAPALKKLATGESISSVERSAAALFIALTAARSPTIMTEVLDEHLASLGTTDRANLDTVVQLWCNWTNKPYNSKSHAEFLKPSSFGAIWVWSQSLQRRLLEWDWHLVRTVREQPFITSDQPVFAHEDREQDLRLVSFPVSSEIALIVVNGGQFTQPPDRNAQVLAMNRQTMYRSNEFVVACKDAFLGDSFLAGRFTKGR